MKEKTNILLINLATRSRYVLKPPAHVGGERVVSEQLRQEDDLYASFLGAAKIDCGLCDVDLRHRQFPLSKRWEMVFQKPERGIARLFLKEIEKHCLPLRPDIIFCPLGVGHHADHEATREAVLRLYEKKRSALRWTRLLFYEDLPYSHERYISLFGILKKMQARYILRPRLVDIGMVLKKKWHGVSLYKSQVDIDKEKARIRRYALLCGLEGRCRIKYKERFWELMGKR